MQTTQKIDTTDASAPRDLTTVPGPPPRQLLPTGAEPLDRLLAGGLLPGTTTEVYGQRSGGRFSIAMSALAKTTSKGRCAALLDLGDSLDPQSAAAAGVALERLLWVRPRRFDQVFASAEAILESDVPLLVIDLGLPPIQDGWEDERAWQRLARSAREHGVALLISSPFRIAGEAADFACETFLPRIDWRARGEDSRVLGGFSSQLELRSAPGEGVAQAGGPQRLSFHTADALEDAPARDVRILEFPAREQDLPSYREIA